MRRAPSLSRLFSLLCTSALLLGATPARADVAPGPGERDVASEVVFTGVRDIPGYRFVIAVASYRPEPELFTEDKLPAPIAVRDGEPISTDTIYFQELRAIPVDTPDPVTDAWVLASGAPTSGVFTHHRRVVPTSSGERISRASFHVRRVEGKWISIELRSYMGVMADGSEQPISKPIPRTYLIESFTAPPGWKLYTMVDPSWPRVEPPPPATPCEVGEIVPLSPGIRTLVAVEGTVGPDGSLDGKAHQAWGRPLDVFHRDEVPADSTAVASRQALEINVVPERKLQVTIGRRFGDAEGRWFEDEGMTIPVKAPASEHAWWTVCAVAAGAAVLGLGGAWAWRRRTRRRGAPSRPS